MVLRLPRDHGLPENQLQPLPSQPRHQQIGLREAGGHQQWVVGAFLEPHCDVPFGDHHVRGRIDEVAEDVLRLGGRVAVADPLAKQSIPAAGHERQLQIATDLHGHCGGESVHVEELDAVGNAVFDEHALRVSPDEVHGRATKLVVFETA